MVPTCEILTFAKAELHDLGGDWLVVSVAELCNWSMSGHGPQRSPCQHARTRKNMSNSSLKPLHLLSIIYYVPSDLILPYCWPFGLRQIFNHICSRKVLTHSSLWMCKSYCWKHVVWGKHFLVCFGCLWPMECFYSTHSYPLGEPILQEYWIFFTYTMDTQSAI